MKKKFIGRPPRIKQIIRVQNLRKKGLTFRQIALLEKADLKTVYRWYQYDVGKIVDKSLDIVGKRV